jgi:osmotically-inducible protein OsmY
MARRDDRRLGSSGYRDRADDRGYVERAADEGRSWFGDTGAERRRRDDQRRDREREWREWDRQEAGWNRSYEPRHEWSPREREWRDYDEHRAREYDLSRPRVNPGWPRNSQGAYWSPYENAGESYMAGADGTTPTSLRSAWGRGPKGYQRADDRITDDVCERLTFSHVDAHDIEVRVQNSEVTLAGSVRNRWEKREAEELAEGVFGVRDVHNQLRVVPPSEMSGIGTKQQTGP